MRCIDARSLIKRSNKLKRFDCGGDGDDGSHHDDDDREPRVDKSTLNAFELFQAVLIDCRLAVTTHYLFIYLLWNQNFCDDVIQKAINSAHVVTLKLYIFDLLCS